MQPTGLESTLQSVASLCDDVQLHAAKASILKQRLLQMQKAIPSLPKSDHTGQDFIGLDLCLERARGLLQALKAPGEGQYWKLALNNNVKEQFDDINKELGECTTARLHE